MLRNDFLVLLGHTAVGKTAMAVELALEFDAEIISADSRQVFSGMDIGTGKDLSEYQIGEQHVPYHLIDIKNAGETYNVNEFKEDFFTAFNKIIEKGKLPLLCGGTGMYIHSLLQNHPLTAVPINVDLRNDLEKTGKEQLVQLLLKYPKPLRAQADLSTQKRLIRAIEIAEYLSKNEVPKSISSLPKPLVLGLFLDADQRRRQILQRLDTRLATGLIEEVEGLLAKGVSAEMLKFYGLEYKFVLAYLQNEYTKVEFKEKLGVAICQFAKRQMTFFRKMEKDGVAIHWFNANRPKTELKDSMSALIRATFSQK